MFVPFAHYARQAAILTAPPYPLLIQRHQSGKGCVLQRGVGSQRSRGGGKKICVRGTNSSAWDCKITAPGLHGPLPLDQTWGGKPWALVGSAKPTPLLVPIHSPTLGAILPTLGLGGTGLYVSSDSNSFPVQSPESLMTGGGG